MTNDLRERARFIREHQLKGGTYAAAVEDWNGSYEIAEMFARDGAHTPSALSNGEITDAVADWRAVRRLGL